MLAGRALANDRAGFIPKPDIGPATITQVHTRQPANILVYLLSFAWCDVYNTIDIVIKAISHSVIMAATCPYLPGIVTTEFTGMPVNFSPINNCIINTAIVPPI